jgi:hypothetical protein
MLAASIIRAISADVSKRLPLISLMMEGKSTSETSVNFYQIIRRNNPEDSHLLEKTSSRLYDTAMYSET